MVRALIAWISDNVLASAPRATIIRPPAPLRPGSQEHKLYQLSKFDEAESAAAKAWLKSRPESTVYRPGNYQMPPRRGPHPTIRPPDPRTTLKARIETRDGFAYVVFTK